MTQTTIYALIVFLHDLFTAIWIGGLFFLVAIYFPVVRAMQESTPALKRVGIAVQNRLRVFVYVSIIGLFITGILLGRQNGSSGGLINFSTPYNTVLSIKHLVIFAMIVIGGVRSTKIHRDYIKLFSSASPKMNEGSLEGEKKMMKMKAEKKSALFVLINLMLGILVLLLTGFLAAYS
jgi:uncharacterized membrane protein